MNSKRFNEFVLVLFLLLTVVASGCISDNQDQSEETPVDNSRTNDQNRPEQDEVKDNSDENGQNMKNYGNISQDSFSDTGVAEKISVESENPTAIAIGPEKGYWVLENGFDQDENNVYRFSEDWQKTGKTHQIYPGKKITYDLHFANGNWWVLGGIQGEKEVFKYTRDWEYTGESYNLDDNAGNIFYDEEWKVLGGPEGSTIITYTKDWNRKSSISIKNESIRNYVAIDKGRSGRWNTIASNKNYEQVLIEFDKEWNFQKKNSMSEGVREDLIHTEEGLWVLDTFNSRVNLYS